MVRSTSFLLSPGGQAEAACGPWTADSLAALRIPRRSPSSRLRGEGAAARVPKTGHPRATPQPYEVQVARLVQRQARADAGGVARSAARHFTVARLAGSETAWSRRVRTAAWKITGRAAIAAFLRVTVGEGSALGRGTPVRAGGTIVAVAAKGEPVARTRRRVGAAVTDERERAAGPLGGIGAAAAPTAGG